MNSFLFYFMLLLKIYPKPNKKYTVTNAEYNLLLNDVLQTY